MLAFFCKWKRYEENVILFLKICSGCCQSMLEKIAALLRHPSWILRSSRRKTEGEEAGKVLGDFGHWYHTTQYWLTLDQFTLIIYDVETHPANSVPKRSCVPKTKCNWARCHRSDPKDRLVFDCSAQYTRKARRMLRNSRWMQKAEAGKTAVPWIYFWPQPCFRPADPYSRLGFPSRRSVKLQNTQE